MLFELRFSAALLRNLADFLKKPEHANAPIESNYVGACFTPAAPNA